MKPIYAYTALLLLGFFLAVVFGLVLVEEIHKVTYAVSSRLNDNQQGA
jgi:hypothetical protein